MAPSRKPVHLSAVSVPAQWMPPRVCTTTARRSSTSPAAPLRSGRPVRIPPRPSSDRRSRWVSARRPRTAPRSRTARARAGRPRQRVKRSRVGEAQQYARTVIAGTDVERDEDRSFVGQRLTRQAVGTPERCLVGGVGLAQVALRPVLGKLAVLGRQVRQERDAFAMFRRDGDDDGLRCDRALVRM